MLEILPKKNPEPLNCKVKANLQTIMKCHEIAVEKHGNQQSKDLLLDKWNAGDGSQMMEVAVKIINYASDELYEMRSSINDYLNRFKE